MSKAKKYHESKSKKWVMRFNLLHPNENKYYGVVTHVGKNLIVIREERDFIFDGVIILPKKIIGGIRDSKYEKCHNSIIRRNGAIKTAKTPKWLEQCQKVNDIVEQLRKRDIWAGVEIIFDKGTQTAFYLGPIVSCDTQAFTICCYDAAGMWEKEYELDYSQVCRIEFDSDYCNHFNDYMRKK